VLSLLFPLFIPSHNRPPTTQVCAGLFIRQSALHGWVSSNFRVGKQAQYLCFSAVLSFSLLSGPIAHLKHICSKERLPFSVACVRIDRIEARLLTLPLYFFLSQILWIPWIDNVLCIGASLDDTHTCRSHCSSTRLAFLSSSLLSRRHNYTPLWWQHASSRWCLAAAHLIV
jgi:hypothetical protein